MQCPVCKTVNLTMADRNGIEIDYCPQCRGVWLDRGELDKIIDRAGPPVMNAPMQPQQPYQQPQQPYQQHHQPPGYPSQPPYGATGPYRKKKREGFLGELFDFD